MSETYTGTGRKPGLNWAHEETTTGVSGVVSADKLIADLRAQLTAAQAEVEQLRGTLKEIVEIGGYWDALGILTLDEAKVFDTARRALEAK